MAEFDTFLLRGGELRSLAGIGPISEEKILAAYHSLKATVDAVAELRGG